MVTFIIIIQKEKLQLVMAYLKPMNVENQNVSYITNNFNMSLPKISTQDDELNKLNENSKITVNNMV